MSEGFSGTQAANVVGITYRQLDYWARTDLIRPSLSDAAGSGSRRRYSYQDLLELRVIKTLLDAGIKLESVREVFEYLRQHVDADIASAHLVINGQSPTVLICSTFSKRLSLAPKLYEQIKHFSESGKWRLLVHSV